MLDVEVQNGIQRGAIELKLAYNHLSQYAFTKCNYYSVLIYLSDWTCLQQGRKEHKARLQAIIQTTFKISSQNYSSSVTRKARILNENA